MTPSAAPRSRFIWLLLVALPLKLWYLVEYTRLPFLRAPIYDSVVYLRQAQAVRDGRFSDATLLSFSPLYGYFLALIDGARHLGAAVLAQLALGLLTAYVLYRVARRLAGSEAAGLLCAALYMGYGLPLSYETKIMSETLALLLGALSLLLYHAPALAQGRIAAGVLCGAVFGLCVLCRASLLFAAPILCALAALPFSPEDLGAWRRRLRRAAAVGLGLGLVFLGNGLWNRAHAGVFVPVIFVSQTVAKTTTQGFADDFAAFNNPQNPGGVANAFDVVQQAEARLRQNREAREGRAAGEDQPAQAAAGRPLWGVDVLGWLRGAPVKLLHTLSDGEVSYDYGYFGERSELRSLSLLPVSFGMLLVLGAVGAFVVARRGGAFALVPHLPLILGTFALTTLFHSSSRYRLPMVLPLCVLGGIGLHGVAQVHDRARRLALQGALLLICAGFAYKTWTYQLAAPYLWDLRVAQSAALLGDKEELSRRLARVLPVARRHPELWQRIDLFARTGGLTPPR